MINIHARCEGVFIGHAIASNYDPSISMAVDISESLLECKQFNASDILSRYLFLYHTKPCEIGETTKYLYQIALNKIKSIDNKSGISRQDLIFDQSIINEFVKITDGKLNGHTAGCGPAQRSFPLALCPWINDDDLFDLSMEEAALTHYNSLAGQVAGIVNVICRSLLKNKSWNNAVQLAFSTPRLHSDVSNVSMRYSRSAQPAVSTHAAYAPTVLNAALHYIANSNNAMEAIEKARAKDKHYCAPIVGILSGALWGIPLDIYKNRSNDVQFQIIGNTANKLGNQWPSRHDHIVA